MQKRSSGIIMNSEEPEHSEVANKLKIAKQLH